MKLIVSLSSAARMVLVALLIGFIAGITIGYDAGTATGSPTDVRTLSNAVHPCVLV